MKLTDLRDELNARAETTDDTPDLLTGVHAKITQTKRRRKAGALGTVGGLAVIAAFATGLIPGLTTSTPQPADDPTPHDYVKNGMMLPAVEGADRLDKGWIGDLGENKLDFSWTPQAQDTRFEGVCQGSASSPQFFTISINGYNVGTTGCDGGYDPELPGAGINVQANASLWLAAPPGKAAQVVVQLSDEHGRAVKNDTTQLALGIYNTAATKPEGPPGRVPPTSADDYVKDSVRYRAKIGGDTLLGAMVADRGKNRFDLTFTATGGPISLSDFCTATGPDPDPQYQLSVTFNGESVSKSSCPGNSLDAGSGSTFIIGTVPPPAGQQVKVTVQLEDNNGKLVTRPNDWIGLGIYAKGKQQTIDGTGFDEVRESNGHNYRLTELKKVLLADAKRLTAKTPADTPFLVSYGTTGEGDQKIRIGIDGLTAHSGAAGGGIVTQDEAARPAASATVTATGADKSPGHLVLAIYLPAD